MAEAEIGILGAGAVGHMLALFLTQHAKLSVQLWGRQGPLQQAQSVVWQGQTFKVPVSRAELLPTFWFCALKSYAINQALRELLPKLAKQSQLIVLSNGYLESILAPLRQEFSEIKQRKGLVTIGIKQQENARYIIGDLGSVLWNTTSDLCPAEQIILDKLQPFGFGWHQDCCQLRREKWFFNSCLNTLCAVYKLPSNGAVLLHHKAELEILARELYALKAEIWPEWQVSWFMLWQKLQQLIIDTHDNENSMAADLRLGRATEAEWLSGLVRKAKNPSCYPLLEAFDRQLLQLP